MGNILENLTAAIESLEKNVKSSLDVMRQQKRDVQQMQDAMRMNTPGINYMRDDNCIVLSAPNVIIGNVDPNGRLYNGGSRVIIRGNRISNEATGEEGGGIIRNRATTIENIAEDPGIDGLESVVFSNSKIVNQARAVTLQSNDELGTFSTPPVTSLGVNIVADNAVKVAALAPHTERKDVIDAKIKECKERSKKCAEAAASYKTNLHKCIEEISKLMGDQNDLNATDDLAASNYEELYGEKHDRFMELESALYRLSTGYLSLLSMEAEAERSIVAMEANKKRLERNTADFAKNTTATSISLNSETVSVVSTDGDGTTRINKEAGFFVEAPHFNFNAQDDKGTLFKDSSIDLNAEKVNLSTVSIKYDDEKKRDSAQITSQGNVTITSKNVTIQGIDNELKQEKITEKALTKGGTFNVRAETMSFGSTDTEGKAGGTLNFNAKSTTIGAMDVDKDTRKPKEMAAGSTFAIQAEKTLIGGTEKSQLVQLASDKVAIIAKTTAEMQQDGKAVVTLSGGSMTAGGSKVELDGNTTIAGNAEIKGETKSPKVTSGQVQAKSAFKSPNINDTMGAGVPGSAKSPSPTLKEEKAQTSAQ